MPAFPKYPVKAWSEEYHADPFYFVQTSGTRNRVIAWSGAAELTRNTFYQLLDRFPFDVEVLLKATSPQEGRELQWNKYYAEVNLSKLTDVIGRNETYVFSNGMCQFWVRNPETMEYFSFDDHGIFYIYSGASVFPQTLSSLGFQEKVVSPIYSKPHFHHRPDNVDYLEQKFLSDLNLEKVGPAIDQK